MLKLSTPPPRAQGTNPGEFRLALLSCSYCNQKEHESEVFFKKQAIIPKIPSNIGIYPVSVRM